MPWDSMHRRLGRRWGKGDPIYFAWDSGKYIIFHSLSKQTLIVEGKKIEMGEFFYADKMVEIAKYYAFDGYLINLESA